MEKRPFREEHGAQDARDAAEAPPQTRTAAATPTRRAQFIQFLKFTGFSLSAGVIQLVSDGILCDWTGWLPWWPAYLISVLLSVVWNFTFNRKFTFRAANNVPMAMALVALYYCAFIPVSVLGGDAIAARLPANLGLLVTFMMMVLNFVTEFLWDKFVVFNANVTEKLVRVFSRRRTEQAPTASPEQEAPTDASEQ